ncbi:helix-turn-helix domain-containing protein [Prosthecomicrobium sp. N25]|uniref:helix-turn-helix domain-containing protein n=1 Tax=Prosthecomicrobium sp. N25 TaxID=3129254 RepID=UPI0030774099
MATFEHRVGTGPGGPRRAGSSTPLLCLVEAAVTASYGLPARSLRRATRGSARVALARQVAMYLCHVRLGMSLTDIGSAFGRDRTTVAHACRLIEDRRDDPYTEAAIGVIEEAIDGFRDIVLAGCAP